MDRRSLEAPATAGLTEPTETDILAVMPHPAPVTLSDTHEAKAAELEAAGRGTEARKARRLAREHRRKQADIDAATDATAPATRDRLCRDHRGRGDAGRLKPGCTCRNSSGRKRTVLAVEGDTVRYERQGVLSQQPFTATVAEFTAWLSA